MVLNENSPSSSNHYLTNDTATIISMTSDSNPSISSVQSAKKNDSANDCSGFHYVSNRKQAAAKAIPTSYLRYRLCMREFFHTRLALISRIMSSLAIFSIILMIIQNELVFARLDNEDTKVSWFLKLIITVTTVILLALILYYHHLDMTAYAFRNRLEDWRMELTFKKIFVIVTELLVCTVHPIPRSYPSTDPPKIGSNSSSLSHVPVDVALSLPMFLRLYLLGRSVMIHSPLVRNIPLRSLGYLNHVSINAYFLIKSYLEKWPTRCLTTFCIAVFLIGSWSLRACDYTTMGTHMSMPDVMWLFIITTTTIGYGDVYPSTYCGRSIATLIGLFGLLFSALLIGIVTQKLHLTREEKYVHTFVLNTRLATNRRQQAANVIKFAIKSWCLKLRGKDKSILYFQAQQKLFQSIHYFREIKQEERSLNDCCVDFPEVITSQRTTNVNTEEIAREVIGIKSEVVGIKNVVIEIKSEVVGIKNVVIEIKSEVKDMKEELNNLNHNLNMLHNTLNILLDKRPK